MTTKDKPVSNAITPTERLQAELARFYALDQALKPLIMGDQPVSSQFRNNGFHLLRLSGIQQDRLARAIKKMSTTQETP